MHKFSRGKKYLLEKIIVVLSLILFANAALAGDWILSSDTQCKLWNPNPVVNESITWSGPCVDGIANGQGVVQWFLNGIPYDRYEGQVAAGRRHGLGVATYQNGVRVEGQFLDGLPNGLTKEILPRKVFDLLKSTPRYRAFNNEGEWINDEFVLLIARDRDQQAVCGSKAMQKDKGDCDSLVALIILSANQAVVKKNQVEELKTNTARCLNATVPNPYPQPDERTEFYGSCDENGVAQNGIVLWKYRDYQVNISCLENGAYAPPSRTDQFKACTSYWPTLPAYCQAGAYQGQCKNGVAHGLGFETASGSTTYVKTGHFEDGMFQGYGYAASVSGCGMAGCSGNRIAEQGWFVKGVKQIDCSTYFDCSTKISGKDLVMERRKWNGKPAANIADLRQQSSFASMLEAFYLSGDRADLKKVQGLAATAQQKATFEYVLLQTAGFDKVLLLNARVKNGQQSVSMQDSEKLLGLFKSIDSKVPVTIDWALKPNKSLLQLQYGTYEINLSIGLNVRKTKRTTFLGFAQSRSDVDKYVQKVTLILSNKNGFQGTGTNNLTVSGAETNSFFGTESHATIDAIDPVISIESVKLKE